MEISDLISIGVIKKVVGNNGSVSVIPDTYFPEQYLSLQSAFIVFSDETVIYKKINSIKYMNDHFEIHFETITSPQKAFFLKNARMMISEDMLPLLKKDEYYPSQLVYYRVITTNNECIGKVSKIFSTPGQEILIIPKDNREIMIPFCDEFVTNIDHENKVITIDPIEGLLNAY